MEALLFGAVGKKYPPAKRGKSWLFATKRGQTLSFCLPATRTQATSLVLHTRT